MAKRMKRGTAQLRPGVGIYTRISADAEGLRLGVERQREDLDALAGELGEPIMGRFEDNDISASTRSAKRRPRYEAMLAAARAGDFGIILAYTSSRLTRRPRENEDLIELAELYGIRFRYLRSPSFDLNTADGRNVARILAANDAAEAERTSERVARAALQRMKQGKFHGGKVAFGYTAEVDSAGKTTAWVKHPEHAQWIVEASERLLNGETFYGIAMDWRAKGRKTTPGGLWQSSSLKLITLSPSVAGLREYEGTLHPAPWEAILERAVWDELVRKFGADATGANSAPHRDARRRYLLAGLLRCGNPGCGKYMNSATDGGRGMPAYFCSKQSTGGCGSMRISMPSLDKWVTDAFLSAADEIRATAGNADSSTGAEARRELAARIAADDEALNKMDDDYYDGIIERPAYLRQRQRISDRIETNRRRQSLDDSSDTRTTLPAATVLAKMWPERDVMWRRATLATAIDHIRITAFPAGMTRTLVRRRGEPDESLNLRRQIHQAEILKQRVHIEWIN